MRFIGKGIFFALALAMLAGCNEESRRYVGSIKVLRAFSVKERSGQVVRFAKGQDTGYGWYVLLGADDQGRRGIALVNQENNLMIPFGVTNDFRLGSSARVPASVTGQGLAIKQELSDVRDGSSTPTTRTESCTNVRTETVCDRIPGRPERCHERTITTSGTREVVITPGGSYYDYTVSLLDGAGNTVAVFDYTDDLTYNSRSEGPCL